MARSKGNQSVGSNQPEYIVIHTAAFDGSNCDAARIDRWHRDRGWQGIGYHYVIINDRHQHKADGTLETGREQSQQGSHTRGLNRRSIGICCVGHGDRDAFTEAQKATLYVLISDLMDRYPAITLARIIGHREVNTLVANGLLSSQYRVNKSCPGRMVDMDQLRREVADFRVAGREAGPNESSVDRAAIVSALQTLNEVGRDMLPNAMEERAAFLNHPEVLAFLKS